MTDTENDGYIIRCRCSYNQRAYKKGCKGAEVFILIRDNNVYIRCEFCRELKLVADMLGYIAGIGNINASSSSVFDECDAYSEKQYVL